MPSIAGFVLRMARESIPAGNGSRTQAGMAEALRVDLGTVQGWESGRRPLANMKAGSLLALRRRLPAFGADPQVVRLLEAAMDADRVIEAGLAGPDRDPVHPLGQWVHTRETAHMIAWALTGTPPPSLAHPTPSRRGPVAKGPLLPVPERTAFFSHLRTAAESASRIEESGVLLGRQALYLTSYDQSADAASWTAHALHARRGVLGARGWTPQWAEARSTAAALARLGDPQPLLDFIERSVIDDDVAEAANLTYWAYWLGALAEPQANDHFMRDRGLAAWDPITLMRCLVYGIHQAPGYVDLYIHSLWALLTAHRWLPMASPEIAGQLSERALQLLDSGRISSRSKRELSAVYYVLHENRT
ncbi:XRE family transcriptional regulator [Streptomyces jumonjinensis]|uniref:XRE family transcriptional regulator n=1 Tax=Streptomyces jumonjinensis TaxID=1945 RepID=UPI00332449A2